MEFFVCYNYEMWNAVDIIKSTFNYIPVLPAFLLPHNDMLIY